MGQRTELHTILLGLCDHVYFQPPPTLVMEYPCIRYSLDDMNTTFANNTPYTNKKRYSVTVIDRDPDSNIPDTVAELPMCVFDRFFTADNLNHVVFKLFF